MSRFERFAGSPLFPVFLTVGFIYTSVELGYHLLLALGVISPLIDSPGPASGTLIFVSWFALCRSQATDLGVGMEFLTVFAGLTYMSALITLAILDLPSLTVAVVLTGLGVLLLVAFAHSLKLGLKFRSKLKSRPSQMDPPSFIRFELCV